MPSFKDIRAKNAQFGASARENAGKPRIRNTAKDTDVDRVEEETFESKRANQKRGRSIVKPAKKDRVTTSGGLKNNRLALGLIVFVVIGGVFFELVRLFL